MKQQKKKIYGAIFNVDDIVIQKLVEANTNPEYLI